MPGGHVAAGARDRQQAGALARDDAAAHRGPVRVSRGLCRLAVVGLPAMPIERGE